MALGTEAPNVFAVNNRIDYSFGLESQTFPYPHVINDLVEFWGEGEAAEFIEDIRWRIDQVFTDDGYKVLAFNIFRQFAIGEALSHDKSDPMHQQVIVAARASLDRLPDLIANSYHYRQPLNDYDCLIAFTGAVTHDYLSKSEDGTSALGNVPKVEQELANLGCSDVFVRNVSELVLATDYQNAANNWIYWVSRGENFAQELGDLTINILATPREYLSNTIQQLAYAQRTSVKRILMQAHVVMADFLGIFTSGNYFAITDFRYPDEISPPLAMISLVDALDKLTGGSNAPDPWIMQRYNEIREWRIAQSIL
ncbi:hypothetical protein KC909_01920 [Candidatus Dojkabacteria bacterium]|uniref:Uncharacterized protein n=1 Tax=Candidatus Dojkabacteria bacterium TaxID=2099670 RepID=A0A955RJ63_9BACT|nr:hypothetical protein [Candidatus Dojkabacteria bacterium]